MDYLTQQLNLSLYCLHGIRNLLVNASPCAADSYMQLEKSVMAALCLVERNE